MLGNSYKHSTIILRSPGHEGDNDESASLQIVAA